MHKSSIAVDCAATYQAEKSSPDQNRYVFSYTIKISNNSDQNISLIARHWLITDGNAQIREVYGDGVIGQQPLILPGESFIYASHTVLDTPIGFMEGKYKMRNTDGLSFNVHIQKFSLSQPHTTH